MHIIDPDEPITLGGIVSPKTKNYDFTVYTIGLLPVFFSMENAPAPNVEELLIHQRIYLSNGKQYVIYGSVEEDNLCFIMDLDKKETVGPKGKEVHKVHGGIPCLEKIPELWKLYTLRSVTDLFTPILMSLLIPKKTPYYSDVDGNIRVRKAYLQNFMVYTRDEDFYHKSLNSYPAKDIFIGGEVGVVRPCLTLAAHNLLDDAKERNP